MPCRSVPGLRTFDDHRRFAVAWINVQHNAFQSVGSILAPRRRSNHQATLASRAMPGTRPACIAGIEAAPTSIRESCRWFDRADDMSHNPVPHGSRCRAAYCTSALWGKCQYPFGHARTVSVHNLTTGEFPNVGITCNGLQCLPCDTPGAMHDN